MKRRKKYEWISNKLIMRTIYLLWRCRCISLYISCSSYLLRIHTHKQLKIKRYYTRSWRVYIPVKGTIFKAFWYRSSFAHVIYYRAKLVIATGTLICKYRYIRFERLYCQQKITDLPSQIAKKNNFQTNHNRTLELKKWFYCMFVIYSILCKLK